MIRATLALALLWPLPVSADDLCPPKYYLCSQARWAFGTYGIPRVIAKAKAKAKACGWTKEDIAEALQCRERTKLLQRYKTRLWRPCVKKRRPAC